MSNGDRSQRSQNFIVAGFGALAIFGAVVLAFAIGNTLGIDSGRDQVSAREHYEKAKQNNLRTCVGRQGSAAVECVAEAIESAQEQSDSRQDLYAQRDMSTWAFWLLIATVITLGVTVVGVWFVKRTLDATLVAVKDTGKATEAMVRQNEISESSQRPWIDVDIRKLHMSSSREVFSLSVDILLMNAGKTPALNILSRATIITGFGKTEKAGEISPSVPYNRIIHNLLPGRSGHNSLHPKMAAKEIDMTVITTSEDERISGPFFMPILEIEIDYEWGAPRQFGKTIKRFTISADRKGFVWDDERLGCPVVLGESPVTKLKTIELAAKEIS